MGNNELRSFATTFGNTLDVQEVSSGELRGTSCRGDIRHEEILENEVLQKEVGQSHEVEKQSPVIRALREYFASRLQEKVA